MNLTPRVLKEGQRQANLMANRIKTAFQLNKIKSWDDIEKQFSISIPIEFKQRPFNWTNVGGTYASFTEFWRNSFQARLEAAVSETVAEKVSIKIDKNVSTYGKRTLLPEQEGCVNSMYEAIMRGNKALLQDGYTGCGKMVMGAALISKLIKNGILNHPDVAWRPYPFVVFCPNAIEEAWKRELEIQGLGEYVRTRRILVFPDSDFQGSASNMFVKEHENLITEEITIKWESMLTPFLAHLDESHRYVNHKSWRTQAIKALLETKPRKCIAFWSATPMEKINDSYLFILALDTQFMGMHVNEDTFKQFSQLLDARPDKPNQEAMKRLRNVLSPYIHSVPYVKPKYKAVNMVWLVDFWKPEHKIIYDTAQDRYVEACEKSGKNTAWGRFEAFVALGIRSKTVEPLRAPHIAERCANNYHSNTFATAVGTKYKETITEIAFQLVDTYKIPREHISVIWGGRKEYKSTDLLTQEELNNLLSGPNAQEVIMNKALRKKVLRTLAYLADKVEHAETTEAQAYRHNKLKELKLIGTQPQWRRQEEIDKFQDGLSKICLFTIATGGIGLSFDKNKPELLQRQGIFTPIYSGKEFQQVLGRLVRRASIADAEQYICMMANTVEHFHVVPILDTKLKCIAEITNRMFDMVDLLNHKVEKKATPVTIHVRDKNQAILDAEKDNTVVTDFVATETNEDESEEEEDKILCPVE